MNVGTLSLKVKYFRNTNGKKTVQVMLNFLLEMYLEHLNLRVMVGNSKP